MWRTSFTLDASLQFSVYFWGVAQQGHERVLLMLKQVSQRVQACHFGSALPRNSENLTKQYFAENRSDARASYSSIKNQPGTRHDGRSTGLRDQFSKKTFEADNMLLPCELLCARLDAHKCRARLSCSSTLASRRYQSGPATNFPGWKGHSQRALDAHPGMSNLARSISQQRSISAASKVSIR